MTKISTICLLLAILSSTAVAFTPPISKVSSNHPTTTTTTTKNALFHTIQTQPSSLFKTAANNKLPKYNDRYPSQRKLHTLHAVPVAAAAAATSTGWSAIAGAVSGGILGGALHAIAGPDHLAALLPRCCGQRWYKAGRIGALWGMGHGVSATLLGLTAFGLKNRISNMPGVKGMLIGASSAMEIAVGASLILIGLLGLKEAREFGEEAETSNGASSTDGVVVEEAQKRAVIFNGLLHGFSWDGAPSLAPAIAVATWRGSISFLLAYALGTMGAMSITTTLIGESTSRAGELLSLPDLPQKLSFFSSILAMAVGVFWCYLAFK